MARIHFKTLGCRLNQAETERMAQGFILAGHEVVDDPGLADIRVVNTCTVTGEAGRKSRRAARVMRPDQKMVVTGCQSEVHPEDFSQADLIVSNADKDSLVALSLERFGMDGVSLGMEYKPAGRLQLYPLVLDHTRAFVKIQDGCNLRCSFCLSTVARGASRSRPADDVIEEVRDLSEKGCREIVLTGVHTGSYGDGSVDLGVLLDRILSETGMCRVRLSSLEPWNFKYSWMALWSAYPERLCRHLHMSLQSGSDTVLRRMRRTYDGAAYAEKIKAIRDAVSDMAITTDLIAGFPGETEKEHRDGLDFVEHMQFAGAHVFTFSPRPGTDAADLPNQVPAGIKQQRYRELKDRTKASAKAFRDAMVGRVLPVLWEKNESDGSVTGLTDNYIRVVTRSNSVQPNTIHPVRIERVTEEGARGEPVDRPSDDSVLLQMGLGA